MMFAIVWATWDKETSGFYFFLGTAYLFIGTIDLIHTLAYKGMNIFLGYDANLPTQLWISGRYLEAMSLFTSFFYLKERPRRYSIIFVYLFVSLILVWSIFGRIFPDCFIEGKGLTKFKIISEYIINFILLAAIFSLKRHRDKFSPLTYRLMFSTIICTMIAELFFTLYISVYGIPNMLGHYFKLISFYLLFMAVVQTSIRDPFSTLFKNLKRKEEELLNERQSLLDALKRIQVLEGLLPICSSCKSIRDKDGNWVQLESYVASHIGAQFTHGICPECMKKLYPEYCEKIKTEQ